MSTTTRQPKRYLPHLETFEARLCLSTIGARPHQGVRHAAVHVRPQRHAAPHASHAGRMSRHAAHAAANLAAAPTVFAAPVASPPVVPIPAPVALVSTPTTTAAPGDIYLAPPTSTATPLYSPSPSPSAAGIGPIQVSVTSTTTTTTISTPTTMPAVAVAPLAPTSMAGVSSVSVPVVTQPVVPEGSLNTRILTYAEAEVGTQVGDGQCGSLAIGALNFAGAKSNFDRMDPNGDFAWGQLGTTLTARSHDVSQVRPGDVIQFRNAQTVTRNGYSTSWQTADHHTAIVESVSGTTITVLNQNVNGQLTVQRGTWNVADLTGGTMWVYHPVTA